VPEVLEVPAALEGAACLGVTEGLGDLGGTGGFRAPGCRGATARTSARCRSVRPT
jgi:hypothetical protein